MKITAVLAAVLALSVSSSYASNTVCMSANTHLKKVYIDGVDYTNQLPGRANPHRCDCFAIPANAGTIAVKAAFSHLQLNKPGIQECETDDHGVYSDWVCAPSKRIKGKWYLPNRSTNNKVWESPATSSCQRSCRHQKKLPCKSSKCFWTSERAASVNCILRKCADGCNECGLTGPGKCDPGKCKYGESTNELLQARACNRVCKLEIKAWNITGTGYIKVTDTPTNKVSTFKANLAGAYLATIDMSTCTLANMNYHSWANEADHANLLQSWQSTTSTNMVNIVGVEVGVGFDASQPGAYPEWIALYNLGVGTGNNVENIVDYYAGLSATLTGALNGVVQLSNKVLTLPSA